MHAVPALLGGSLASSMQELSSGNECLPSKDKKRRGKKSPQSKENLVDLLKEYRLEQKLKQKEREKNLKEMHLEKMRPVDRLLELHEKDIFVLYFKAAVSEKI